MDERSCLYSNPLKSFAVLIQSEQLRKAIQGKARSLTLGFFMQPSIETEKINDGESAIIRGEDWQIVASKGSSSSGKGGGNSNRTPQEADNTLRSKSTATVVYLLSEGEIEGPATYNLLQDIYLDDTPIQNKDGSLNFQDVAVEYRGGTQSQPYIQGFSDIESETAVSVKVAKTLGAIVRSFTDVNANAVTVRLMTPQLQLIEDKTGDIKGSRIDFRIELSTDGGAFSGFDTAIVGKTTSNYERSYRINLPKPGSTYQIRITRLTDDSKTNKLQNDLYWQSFKTIVETKLSYPNCALLGIRINAEQFRSIPKVSMRLKGLRVKYPNNYNPVTRTYSGIWNGGFTYGYTNNPAWIFYDILTNPRYGCGKFIAASQVRTDQLYTIARYCDELVPNGLGGFEPRFVCNAYIQSREEAYRVLDSLASVFRGMSYWGNGTIQVVQDSPTLAARSYSPANVVQEIDDQGNVTQPCFTYSGTSRKARHTVALVSWSDPADNYKTKIEYVEDREGIARYGYRETQIVAFGCTSRGQAHRVGRWLVYSERYETEIVNFTVGTEGAVARPGEIIKIADPVRANVQYGGRILSGTTTQITLDRVVNIEPGVLNVISVTNNVGILEETYVVSPPGVRTTIDLQTPLTEAPTPGSTWLFFTENIFFQYFRVISVSAKEGNKYAITALEYNESKFAAIEQNLQINQLPISYLPNLNQPPVQPNNLTATESLYESGSAGIRTKVVFSWVQSVSPGIDRYQIEYKVYDDPADFKILNYSIDNNYEWLNVQPNVYLFRVCAINKLGYSSVYASIQQQIYGLASPPSDLTNPSITVIGDQALLRWTKSPDLDVQTGGFIKIKFTSKTSNVTWQDGFDVGVLSGATDSGQVPLYGGTYMLKAVDSTGNESANPAYVDTSTIVLATKNLIATLTEQPAWSGKKYNAIVLNGALQLPPDDYIDAEPSVGELIDDGSEDIDFYPQDFDSTSGYMDDPGDGVNLGINIDDELFTYWITPTGTYEFSQPIDLGGIFTTRLSAKFSSTIVDLLSLIDSGTEDFDSQELIDGGSLTGATAKLRIALSNNGFNYSEWQDFQPGDYQCRYVKAKIDMATEKNNYSIVVDQAEIMAEMPDRTEFGTVQSSASSGTAVIYSAPFRQPPILTISIEDGVSGDYYTINTQSAGSFSVSIRDSTGALTSRKVNWSAQGVGKAISPLA